MTRSIRIGTRASRLALAQTESVVAQIRAAIPDLDIEMVPIRTEGDRVQSPNLPGWGTGVFVRDIERALLDGRIDLAVHSMKDVPPEVPDGLALLATPPRADPRDVLVTASGADLAGLPAGAVVGTSSQRRVAFLRAARPDLQFIPIRGNIDTRVAKLLREDSEFDAIVLAAAGLERLGLADLRRTFLDTSILLPAPGQGALVIEGRRDDPRAREIAAVVNDPATWPAVMAERALVQALDAGCRLPVGALATVLDSGLNIEAAVASLDASTVIRDGCSGRVDDAAAVGAELGRRLRERGAAALVASPGGRQ